jgi:hypothetical protein
MNKVNEIFRRTKWPDDNSDLIGLGFEVAEVCFILINFLTGMLGPPPPKLSQYIYQNHNFRPRLYSGTYAIRHLSFSTSCDI